MRSYAELCRAVQSCAERARLGAAENSERKKRLGCGMVSSGAGWWCHAQAMPECTAHQPSCVSLPTIGIRKLGPDAPECTSDEMEGPQEDNK